MIGRSALRKKKPAAATGRSGLMIGLITLLIVLPAGRAFSQMGEATIYLPPAHPAYEDLEHLRAAGLIQDAFLDRRPLSRLAVARALTGARDEAARRNLTALVARADRRLREFAPEVRLLGGQAPPEIERPLSFSWSDGTGASMTAEMTMEAAWSNRTDLPPDHQQALIGRGGIEIYGTAGPGIGYAARYRQSSETRDGTITTWPNAWEQGIFYSRRFRDWVAYTESSGHVSIDTRHIGFDLAMDSPAWGPSPGRNLLLSGRAPSFGHVQARVAFGDWFRYGLIIGSLNSGIIDSLRSYHPPESEGLHRILDRIKYLVAHRIDLRPLPNLNIGLTEAVTIGDRFPELHYLVPAVSLWDSQHYLRNPDNMMIGVDASYAIPNGPRLYGSLAVDEFSISEAFSDSAHHNWLAFQAGLSWTPPIQQGRWHLWLEATRVLPNVYRHRWPVTDWIHAGHGLGVPTDQNSEVFEGSLAWLASERARLAVWGRYARKGGEVSRREQYTIPPSEEFLMGDVRTAGWVGLRISFEGNQHWMTTAEITRAPRRIFPLEVFGTVCGGARTISAGGVSIRAWVSCSIRRLRSAKIFGSFARVSASTITRSFPVRRSALPKTATEPLRIPGRSPMASSNS